MNYLLYLYFLLIYNLAIFHKFYEDLDDIVKNIISTKTSDIIIAYGINNWVAKIFINKIIADKQKDRKIGLKFKIINFNAYIHMGDDYIMDKLCKEMGLNPDKCNFDGFQKAIEKYFNKSEEEEDDDNYIQDNSEKLRVSIRL